MKLLYCAVNNLRGSGITDRKGELPPWQAECKKGPLLSLFLLNFFTFFIVFFG